MRGLISDMTFPKPVGGVWMYEVTKIAGRISQSLNAASPSGVGKHSWIAKSAPLAYWMNHWFGRVSPPNTKLSPFHSRR